MLVIGASLATSAAFTAAWAQIGSSTDIVTGVVRREAKRPLKARKSKSRRSSPTSRVAHGRTQRAVHGALSDGGGQYRIRVRALGLAPQEVMLARQSDEDRLVAEIQMSATPTQIAGVTVRGRQDVPRDLERRRRDPPSA